MGPHGGPWGPMGPLAPIPPSGYSCGVAPPGHITLVQQLGQALLQVQVSMLEQVSAWVQVVVLLIRGSGGLQ